MSGQDRSEQEMIRSFGQGMKIGYAIGAIAFFLIIVMVISL